MEILKQIRMEPRDFRHLYSCSCSILLRLTAFRTLDNTISKFNMIPSILVKDNAIIVHMLVIFLNFCDWKDLHENTFFNLTAPFQHDKVIVENDKVTVFEPLNPAVSGFIKILEQQIHGTQS